MFVKRLTLLSALVLVPASAALAQSETAAASEHAAQAIFMQAATLAPVRVEMPTLASAAAQGARTPQPPRGYFFRGFVGGWVGAGDGFLLGGGASARPFMNKQHEINGNVSFLHVEGSNGFGVDVNYDYNFASRAGQRFTPFAGAGINIAHFGCDVDDELEEIIGDIDCGATDAALQIGGGVKRPLAMGREFFVEGYFAFFYGSPFIIRAGIGW